jgi:pyruvate formate lyase activating enzyme
MEIEARWYTPLQNGTVKCELCPHKCVLSEGKTGICRVRRCVKGKLVTEVYGYASSISFDPVEKKPLFHFNPGSVILSLGTYGCNLRCFFCQNCGISQSDANSSLHREYYTPEQLVQLALKHEGNCGIAFTYNEPVVWFEYMFEIAKASQSAGLKTVMVTNGFISEEPLREILPYIDAFSVDLKAFTEEFYHKVTSSSLEPVKRSLQIIRDAGKHLELVNLLIEDLNDNDEQFELMTSWISEVLGMDTVLHLTRYYPEYLLKIPATDISILRKKKRLATRKLKYVYTGNIPGETNDTHCSICNNLLITRNLHQIQLTGIDKNGQCSVCGNNFLKKL